MAKMSSKALSLSHTLEAGGPPHDSHSELSEGPGCCPCDLRALPTWMFFMGSRVKFLYSVLSMIDSRKMLAYVSPACFPLCVLSNYRERSYLMALYPVTDSLESPMAFTLPSRMEE